MHKSHSEEPAESERAHMQELSHLRLTLVAVQVRQWAADQRVLIHAAAQRLPLQEACPA